MIISLTLKNTTIINIIIVITTFPVTALPRSRDRPVLVCGPWSETNRPLWEEAQPRRGSGQRGGEISGQDAAAAQQPQKQAGTGEELGRRGQPLVPVTSSSTSFSPVTRFCAISLLLDSQMK